MSTYGATWIWTGGGAPNGNWNSSANWGSVGIPGNGDTVIFQGAAGLNTTNNIASLTLNQIKFISGGFNLYGNPFTLTNSLIASNFTGNITISNSFTIATSDVTILASNNITLSLKGIISGTVGVVKTGQGTLLYQCPGNNLYNGTTLVSSGLLELNVQGASAFSGPLVIGDGSGLNNPTVENLQSTEIPDGVPVTINLDGTLNLNNFSEIIGANLHMNGGVIQTGTGILTFSPNTTITLNDAFNTSFIIGNLNTSTGTLTLQGNGNLNLSANVSGLANIVQNDLVTSVWAGSNTYSGNFTANANGYVDLVNAQALGNITNKLTLNGQCLVALATSITNQSLIINTTNVGFTSGGPYATIYSFGLTNIWQANFILGSNCTMLPASGSTLRLVGPISGPGGFMQLGGTLFLDGSISNSYTGTTIVSNGATLMLNNSVLNGSVPGNLDIKGTVRYANYNQIADTADVFVESGGTFDFAVFYDYINTLHGTGSVTFGTNGYLNIGAADGSSTFDGLMSGPGFTGGYTVGKYGSGTFTMTANNTFQNALYVSGGTLLVDGNQPQNPVEGVLAGTTLGGTGTVGSFTAIYGMDGTVAPGNNGPGILTCSNMTFTSTSTFKVEMTGPNPGVGGYDQLNVLGTNTLANATLAVIPAFTTPVSLGQQFTIIKNDLGDANIGVFNGLPEGSAITAGNHRFTISYFGGTGNDVVLTLISIPGATVASSVTSGDGSHGIDPNGCNNFSLVISNSTGTAMAGVMAMLSTSNENVLITQPLAAYPNIPAHGLGTNITQFQVTVLPSFICGTTINLQLSVNSSLGAFRMNYNQISGEPATPLRYDVTGNVAIPDVGSVDSTNIVTGFVNTPLQKVAVSLYITHPFDSDLTNISLISPDGTKVLLSSANGGSGQNYGSGLTPDSTRTTFDDAAGTPVTSGVAPFVGTFRPQSPLSAFIGNATPNGSWHLHIADGFGGSLGTLRGWSLFLSGTGCGNGGGACALCAGGTTLTNTLTANSSATARLFRSGTTSDCGSAKGYPGVVAGSFNYHVYPFYNSTSNTCITVSLTSFGGDLFTSAYLGSFDPSDLSVNYLGDAGNSTGGAGSTSFSVNVPPNSVFVVVVNTAAALGSYTLNVSGGDCAPVLNITPAGPNKVDVAWPTVAGGYNLNSTPRLVSPAWTGVTNEPLVSGGMFQITNSSVNPSNRFYRLQKP